MSIEVSSTSASLKLDAVSKSYGAVTAVKPLTLEIAAGSLVTLLGPSGCGKTTLLRMIAGLERVSDGRILIGDRDVTRMSAGERDVSMVFQSYALFPHMSVLQNVCYGLVSSGVARRDAQRRADEALESVGLKGFGDRLPSEMSGGQQQRVAVARALVLNPSVLLFDEPLSNLDAKLRRSMREEIRALQQRLGITVVYVTHDQSEALAVSDQIVVMRNAEIAQLGTPRELYASPDNVFVATFMGDANHLHAVLERKDGDLGTVRLGSLALHLPHRDFSLGNVDLILRPESVVLYDVPTEGVLRGRVATSTYMGAHVEYNLDTEAGPIFAIQKTRMGKFHQPGEEVGIGVEEGTGALLVRS